MKKIISGILCVFLLLSPKVVVGGSPSREQFSLPPLSKDERIKLFEELIYPYDFVIERHSENISEEECNKAFLDIKTGYKDNIIEASSIYWDLVDSKNIQEFAKCNSTLKVNENPYPPIEYFPSKKEWTELPTSFYMKSNYVEIYDLSNIFEPNIYAMFTEGGRPDCNGRKKQICSNLVGFETRAKLVDAGACEITNDSVILASRVRTSTYRQNNQITAHKTDNFFAFIKNKNALQQIAYRNSFPSCEGNDTSNNAPCMSTNAEVFLNQYWINNGHITVQHCFYKLTHQ